jgi:hypothetical protein
MKGGGKDILKTIDLMDRYLKTGGYHLDQHGILAVHAGSETHHSESGTPEPPFWMANLLRDWTARPVISSPFALNSIDFCGKISKNGIPMRVSICAWNRMKSGGKAWAGRPWTQTGSRLFWMTGFVRIFK